MDIIYTCQGNELEQNVSAGVLASESTLALQRIGRQQSGAYQCKASNVEGDSISNVVNISIKCKYLIYMCSRENRFVNGS